MFINQATVDLIKEFEGFSADAYKDSAGVWTIGYGTTARAGVGIEPKAGMRISKAEAEEYLRLGIEKFAEHISTAIKRPINENEFGAFVSLAYNIGPTAFINSSALRLFNSGDKAGAAKKILLWNKAGGQVLKGLIRRREAERALFLAPVSMDSPAQLPERKSVAQSTTVRASAVQIASGVGSVASAIGMFGDMAQLAAIIIGGVIILSALWIVRERLRKWAAGDR